MDSKRYDELVNFILHKEKPKDMSENQLNWLRQQAKKYIVDDDKLKYLASTSHHTCPRVVAREQETRQIYQEIHESKFGLHPGINTTIRLISQRYYWPNLTKDVKKWVKECASCQMNDPIRPPRAPELQPISVKRPFEMVGIDLMGPFNQTSEGFKYVFTCTDYFTKWVEAFPMKTKTAVETASCLEKVISRHGAFQAILTDQGREFVNQVNENLCKSWNIQHKVTAAYHPQTNGLDERTNQTLKQKLRKAVNENQNNWDKFLDGALFSMRMAPQASTKYSPFRLLYGRELPEMPLNLTAVPPLPSETLLNEFVEVTEMKRTDVEEKVKQNIKTAQEKQKKDYKKRKSVGYHEFGVGDTVKLFNSKKKAKKGIVLEENYLGPYEIINITGKKCSLKCKKSGKVLKSNQNIDNIKHFKKKSGNKSMNEFLESLSKMGILQDILDGCQQFNLPKVKSIADIETAMNDPVYSFVSEVSKSNEGVMDVAAAIITPFVTSTSLTQKTDIVTIASSVFTKAYVSDLSPKDVMHSLEVLPPFFKKTPPMEDLEKSERIIVNGESVTVEDIQTLKGKAWLNDRVVNAYLKNLARSMNDTDRPKAFVIPSYTGTLWSHDVYDSHMFRKVKFGLFEYILMPWCLNSHWVLLVANVQKRTVGVVDSLHGDNSFIIARFCQYMMQRGSVCEPELADCWVTVEIQTNKQQDGCSCGVFVLMNAECILKGKSCLLMRQVHVDPLRKHIKNHLLHAGRKTNERECDGLTCKKPRGPSNWIQCDMCHRWWHRVCGQVERKQIIKEYLCQICVAQYH